MRRIVVALFFILLLVPVGWAQDKRLLEAETIVQEGLAHTQTGNYEQAISNFRQAIQLRQEAGYATPPPGLVLNVALAYDKAPGRHLAAAAWYKTYLALAPDDPRAPKIRERANVLLREFDQSMLLSVDVMEQLYDVRINTVQQYEKELAFWKNNVNNPAYTDVPGQIRQLQDWIVGERSSLAFLLLQIQTIRVAAGDAETALRKIREYKIKPIEHAMLGQALTFADYPQEAEKYRFSGTAFTTKHIALLAVPWDCNRYNLQEAYRTLGVGLFDYDKPVDDPAFIRKTLGEHQFPIEAILSYAPYYNLLQSRQYLRFFDEKCGTK